MVKKKLIQKMCEIIINRRIDLIKIGKMLIAVALLLLLISVVNATEVSDNTGSNDINNDKLVQSTSAVTDTLESNDLQEQKDYKKITKTEKNSKTYTKTTIGK